MKIFIMTDNNYSESPDGRLWYNCNLLHIQRFANISYEKCTKITKYSSRFVHSLQIQKFVQDCYTNTEMVARKGMEKIELIV